MRVGRRLLGASNIVAGVAVQGDLGWRKLEERRKERKCCLVRDWKGWKRVDLVKLVMEKLREDRNREMGRV